MELELKVSLFKGDTEGSTLLITGLFSSKFENRFVIPAIWRGRLFLSQKCRQIRTSFYHSTQH